MTGFYTFTPAIFHACHLVHPSDRGECELPNVIDLLIQSGRTVDAIRLDGWRIDVGYPEDRDRAEERLDELIDDETAGEASTETEEDASDAVDRRFKEPNPEYYVVFEPIEFTQWFDLADEYREQGRDASAAAVYQALVESLNDNMERVDGAYDHFSQAFARALDGYVECAAAADCEADGAADAVSRRPVRAVGGRTPGRAGREN